MRAQLLLGVSVGCLVVLLGATAPVLAQQALAKQAAAPEALAQTSRGLASEAPADAAAPGLGDLQIPLPDVPSVVVAVGDDDDVTGSIERPPVLMAAPPAAEAAEVPPALPFDDQAPRPTGIQAALPPPPPVAIVPPDAIVPLAAVVPPEAAVAPAPENVPAATAVAHPDTVAAVPPASNAAVPDTPSAGPPQVPPSIDTPAASANDAPALAQAPANAAEPAQATADAPAGAPATAAPAPDAPVTPVASSSVPAATQDSPAPARIADVSAPPAAPDRQAAALPLVPATAPPLAVAAIPLSDQSAAQPPPASPGPTAPPVPPLDAQTVTPPSPPVADATAPQGLGAPELAQALAAFGADNPAGPETAAQAAERRKTRDMIVAFYAARANAPLWVADGHLTPAARSVLTRLDHASEDGLDLRRFAVAVPRSGDTTALARAELALSEAVVAYGRQATGSRIDVARLGVAIDLRPDVADAARILSTVAAAADPGEALQAFNPQSAGYTALRQKLAELRRQSPPEAQSRIPEGPVLKPGMRDVRVPLVRARFGLDVALGAAAAPDLVYDTKVAAAVADFQRANGLPASGQLTRRTIAVLSGDDPARLENAIVANMEEWRWLPRDLGPDHIEVNIPDYTVQVFRDGAVMHQARVVVGQPDKPTPVFAQTMKFVIVNPYWNVPLSIIKKEMMPKLAADPNYFENHGYEVIEHNGATYVRQPPGDGNALGRIKFMFPNNHSVYLHDTNARSYFARDVRALSHGCVRVDLPFSFAEAVLGKDNGWTEARVKKMIGGQERTISLPKPLPIYIVYFTAFVDAQAGFRLRDDVYGYENRIELALGLQN